MSTQPTLTPQWKDEVNRRLAAHKSRKGQATAEETSRQAAMSSSRAAEAAARVAARYAKAPSYSQMQAEEARIAVRAAEIATKVALQAQAAAETVLAEMHAATEEKPSRGPAVVQPFHAPGTLQASTLPAVSTPEIAPVASTPLEPSPIASAEPAAGPSVGKANSAEAPNGQPEHRRIFGIRWDPDLPKHPADRKPDARRSREEFELSVDDWWSPAEVSDTLRANPIEVGEVDQPFANLIEFPRELVAARKVRPEAGRDKEDQLSIFEVDPATVSTEPGAPAAGQDGASISNGAEWSGIKLDTLPAAALSSAPEADPARDALPVASLGLRLMAAVVDCALILASFVIAGFLFAHNVHDPPVGRPAELLGAAGLMLIGILYYACFFAIPVRTPGMMYAGIGLCTFDNQSPTRSQLRRRLVAIVLSILPVGLGLVWSLFDDDQLSWHDRYSQTFLRKC